ncbi:50S ribosomal protein L11 methyltransferase [Candidatus Magnetaquicoccus inordinatus]|uniref:50S ribosomal protein L11 methyltransferase n=1 Tax=Candidatus Magnetaquicoccus inordinatus TaxID=2496818 RepID=UPI00102CA191|nr:50S ribosomal protein L11 methyltransferase [Candidatus Magnetaquicoccus inordinatus]
MIYELSFVAPQALDGPLSELLTEFGSMGVVLEDIGNTAVFSPLVHFERCRFKGYFAEESDRLQIEVAIRALLLAEGQRGNSELHWLLLQDEDWQNHWKRYFRPLPLGQRLLVLPSWLQPPEGMEERLIIRIDPEMAFGSGNHETTRGCLEMLEWLAEQGPLGSVLDMGTGSGILLIGAMLLGAEQGIGVDVDPLAVEICTRNCRSNLAEISGMWSRLRFLQDDQLPSGPFQTVVANILAPDLTAFLTTTKPRFADCLVMGGHLLLAGMLHEQGSVVEQIACQNGFVSVRHERVAEWSILLLRRE